MNKLLEWSLGMWTEIQLSAPPVVRDSVLPRIHEAKEIARLLIRPRLTIHQWQGQGQGGPLTVNYAGLGYAGPYLKDLLFEKEPTEREISYVPIWSPGEQVKSLAGDLTIIEAGKQLINKLPSQGNILLPLRLLHIVDVQREWDDLWLTFSKSARKQDVRLTRKYGYEYEISHHEKDFEMFYKDMYLPTISDRHGELASITPITESLRYFRHGFLLMVKRDGRFVSAGLCTMRQKMVSLAETGVIDGDFQLTREGAVASIYYFLVQWAHQQGLHSVSFGGCWPFLNDGIFQFKRKWGTTVRVSPRENKRIWIKVHRDTPAVRQFLRENPCVLLGKEGELQGLMVTDNGNEVTPEERAAWEKRYETPGLSGFIIRPVTDLVGEPDKDGQKKYD